MHCSRDISEKILKKRVLSPLPVSIQVIRLRGAGRGREEMLLSYVTDTKPSEVQGYTKSAAVQAALPLGDRQPCSKY